MSEKENDLEASLSKLEEERRDVLNNSDAADEEDEESNNESVPLFTDFTENAMADDDKGKGEREVIDESCDIGATEEIDLNSEGDDDDDTVKLDLEENDEEEDQEIDVPFPWARVIPICIVTLAEGLTSSVLLPFVSFMVIGFGFEKNNVGFAAGFLTTAYFLGQFLGGFGVGSLSDKIGRKPILLFGLIANFAFVVAFGFSVNIYMAFIFRLSNGFLNGSLSVTSNRALH